MTHANDPGRVHEMTWDEVEALPLDELERVVEAAEVEAFGKVPTMRERWEMIERLRRQVE